eukprot:snap_masked-scaffold_41-processed-gene-1.2-mRNA-1 protein AED:1.00 eAED:1.00 QI:0/-1/0/0/-1/1/1/0/146
MSKGSKRHTPGVQVITIVSWDQNENLTSKQGLTTEPNKPLSPQAVHDNKTDMIRRENQKNMLRIYVRNEDVTTSQTCWAMTIRRIDSRDLEYYIFLVPSSLDADDYYFRKFQYLSLDAIPSHSTRNFSNHDHQPVGEFSHLRLNIK